MKTYVILGSPTPLARPRFAFKKIYDCQKNAKNAASLNLAIQHGNDPLLEGPLHFDVTFFMQTPQSQSKLKQSALLNKPHVFKPDLSNLLKFCEDLCSGIIFNDDCIISSITCKKVYDANPRTEFTLKPL